MLMAAQLALVSGSSVVDFLYRAPAVRIVVPYVSQFSSLVSPYGLGVDGELLSSFAKEKGYTVSIVRVRSKEEAWRLISADEADVLVGFGGAIPEKLKKHVTAGPAYDDYVSVSIKDTKNTDNKELEALCASFLNSVPEGVESEVLEDEAPLADNETLLGALSDAFPDALPDDLVAADNITRDASAAKADSIPKDALDDEDCVDFDRFHMYHLMNFDGDEGGRAEIDGRNFAMLRPFFLDVVPVSQSSAKASYRWFWRNKFFIGSGLQTDLQEFWDNVQKTNQVSSLKEKHYGFFPESLNYYVIGKLKRAVRKKVPIYMKTMGKASVASGVDPLLLTAVIFQESHFNSRARSRTGVRGLMQITMTTAKELGINRLDPHQSIMGGAKYLRSLWERFGDMDLAYWDRWFFALAAYNQGYGHVTDAIELAKKRGGTGKSWTELKETLPLLAWKRYFSQAKYGYCRGYEAVTYVENIRYYFYLLNGLVALSRPEGENLGALRSSFLNTAPGV